MKWSSARTSADDESSTSHAATRIRKRNPPPNRNRNFHLQFASLAARLDAPLEQATVTPSPGIDGTKQLTGGTAAAFGGLVSPAGAVEAEQARAHGSRNTEGPPTRERALALSALEEFEYAAVAGH